MYTTESAQPFSSDLHDLEEFLRLVGVVAAADRPTEIVIGDLREADEALTERAVLRPVPLEVRIGDQTVRRVVDYEATPITAPLRALGMLAACTNPEEYTKLYKQTYGGTDDEAAAYKRDLPAVRRRVARTILIDLCACLPLSNAYAPADVGNAVRLIRRRIELLSAPDEEEQAVKVALEDVRGRLHESAARLRANNRDETPLPTAVALANIGLALDRLGVE